jgi:hypothetical protein
VLAGAADELTAHRALACRSLRVDHVLADRLTRAREATRAEGEHLLEHDLRQRVAVGEVRVRAHRDLTATVHRAHPRAPHGHPASTERHAAVLMAVTHRDTLVVMTALRTDDIVDLLSHQLRQHAQPTPTLSASSPSFAAPASSPSASCTRSGSASNLRSPISSAASSTFLMAVLLSS